MAEIILDLLKIILPSIAVLAAAYLVLSSMLENNIKAKQIEVALKSKEQSMMLKLQAYERLILFLERINPSNLISRLNQADISLPEMQMVLISSVRAELEHNITQQLYVSDDAWTLIKASTEETVAIINGIAKELPQDASGSVLNHAIVEFFLAANQPMPGEKAIALLKEEAKMML